MEDERKEEVKNDAETWGQRGQGKPASLGAQARGSLGQKAGQNLGPTPLLPAPLPPCTPEGAVSTKLPRFIYLPNPRPQVALCMAY